MKERVNHPQHYSHPSGVECIDIIRHHVCDIANALKYLWRAGLKEEEGMTSKEKELEDLQKALWYLRDYQEHFSYTYSLWPNSQTYHPSGVDSHTVTRYYSLSVALAIEDLWCVGIIVDSHILVHPSEEQKVSNAIKNIEKRIDHVRQSLFSANAQSSS